MHGLTIEPSKQAFTAATHRRKTHFEGVTNCFSFDPENSDQQMDKPGKLLVSQLSQGSAEAFDIIYNQNFHSIFNFAKSFVRDRHNAEDICADIFTKLWENRSKLAHVENIHAYLLTSARNACLNFLKSAIFRNQKELEIAERLEKISLPADYAEVLAEFESKERLRKEIENLPAQCQRVFKLAYFEQLDNGQIATLLGISKKTASNQKIRAIQLLRIAKNLLVPAFFLLYLLSR